MKKKILFGFAAVAIAVTTLPLFAAFEAHVINVTAKIENALNVPLGYLDFGTVFPQEHLDKLLDVNLSQSFLDEGRVDDVQYFIRQKPKCAITRDNGTWYDNTLDQQGKNHIYTRTGHLKFDGVDKLVIDCGETPRELAQGETWGPLPMLCPYISKHPDGKDDNNATDTVGANNDGSMNSFHYPWIINGHQIVWNDTKGHLAKSQIDTKDKWTIDLAVPCFGGYCAQDWEDFVRRISASSTIDASDFTQPIESEHKIFGCDLWVEVGGISLPGLGCNEKVDVMIVMDNSGSISGANYTIMQNAAKAFVDALLLSPDGPHSGKVAFATGATLDQILTDDAAAVKAAIDIAQTGGATNLSAGIDVGQAELAGANGRADAPNVMIILTDGAPNIGSPSGPAAGIASATAAKDAGTEIFAVGIGTDAGTSAYLHDEIVSDVEDQHYFDSLTFDDLEAILTDLVSCDN